MNSTALKEVKRNILGDPFQTQRGFGSIDKELQAKSIRVGDEHAPTKRVANVDVDPQSKSCGLRDGRVEFLLAPCFEPSVVIPGFTAIAVLTLALEIGLSTTVFTVYDSVAVRLLPVKDAKSLVRLMRWYQDGSRDDQFTVREFEYVRDQAKSFGDVIVASPVAGRTFTVVGIAKSVRSTNLSKVDPAYIYFPASASDAAH